MLSKGSSPFTSSAYSFSVQLKNRLLREFSNLTYYANYIGIEEGEGKPDIGWISVCNGVNTRVRRRDANSSESGKIRSGVV